MISPWEIYWVLQLDNIGVLFGWIAICGSIAVAAAFCGLPVWCDSDLCPPRYRKWIVVIPVVLLVIGGVGKAFLPSTKTAAAMLVIPAIANNEKIQHEAGELYGLAKDALKRVGKDEPAEPAKADK